MPDFAGELMQRAGDRIRARFDSSLKMDEEGRKAEADKLWQSIIAKDENGNPALSPDQAEEAYSRIAKLYGHNKNSKDILARAKDVIGKLHMLIKPNGAMASRTAQQAQSALQNPPSATATTGPTESVTSPDGSTQQQFPLTPPPGQVKQPVQQVAAAASTQPVSAGLTPPPQRTSSAELAAAGAPNPVKTQIAREGRDLTTKVAEEGRANAEVDRRRPLEQADALARIAAQKEGALDKEIDTFTTDDGYRATKYQRPNGTVYTVKDTVKVKESTPTEKSLQGEEVVFTNGKHGLAYMNPDPTSKVRWMDAAGNDISSTVTGKYYAPSASIQMMNAGAGSIDHYVEMVNTGQIKSIAEIPIATRNQVVQRMGETGAVMKPPAIRERMVAIEGARQFLKPIEELVDRINKEPDLTKKAETSYLLETYTSSISTLMARSLGERGVATEGDVDRARGLAPGWKAANFNPEYAKTELGYLKGIMDSQEKALDVYFKEGGGKSNKNDGERVKVKGPNGQTGSVPKGSKLPAGWTTQ